MPENAVWYEAILKWGSLFVAGMFGVIWKKNEKRFENLESGLKLKSDDSKVNSMNTSVVENRRNFQDHLLADAQEHLRFVTHEYLEKELKPLIDGIGKRTDKQLEKVDAKLEQIMHQTADVIKRNEYKSDINKLHDKIDLKQDKAQ